MKNTSRLVKGVQENTLEILITGFRDRTVEKVQVKFREVSQTGVFFADTEANHKNSMALLRQNGFRPLTYQEALEKIDQSPELKEQLKGEWFYLEGKDSAVLRNYTFNDEGELTQGKGDIEKTVRVYEDPQPLALYVRSNNYAYLNAGEGERYVIQAEFERDGVASVVVGVRAGHEVATPKIEVSQSEQPETITLSGTSLNTFKAVHRIAEQELSRLIETIGSENLPNIRKLVEALRIKE